MCLSFISFCLFSSACIDRLPVIFTFCRVSCAPFWSLSSVQCTRASWAVNTCFFLLFVDLQNLGLWPLRRVATHLKGFTRDSLLPVLALDINYEVENMTCPMVTWLVSVGWFEDVGHKTDRIVRIRSSSFRFWAICWSPKLPSANWYTSTTTVWNTDQNISPHFPHSRTLLCRTSHHEDLNHTDLVQGQRECNPPYDQQGAPVLLHLMEGNTANQSSNNYLSSLLMVAVT